MNVPVRSSNLAPVAPSAPVQSAAAPSPAELALVSLERLLESLEAAAAQSPALGEDSSARVLACAAPPPPVIVLPRPDAPGQLAAAASAGAGAGTRRRARGSPTKGAGLVFTAAGAIVAAVFLLQEDDRFSPAPRLAHTAEQPDAASADASAGRIEVPSSATRREEGPPGAESTPAVETTAPSAAPEPSAEAAVAPRVLPVAAAPLAALPIEAAPPSPTAASNDAAPAGGTPAATGGAEADEASEPPLPPERPDKLGRRAKHGKSAKTPKAPQTLADMSAATADVEQPSASARPTESPLLGAFPLLRAIGVK